MNIRVFYKLAILFSLVIAKHAQSTQNSKFVISLQYLYEEGRDEVDFLHANRHQDVLHLMSLMLVGMIRPAQIPKVTSLHNLSNVSRKKWGMKLIFVKMSITVFYKLMLSFFVGCGQACLKYSVTSISVFAISQRFEIWSWRFACWLTWKAFESW